MGDMAHIMTSV